MQLHEMNLWQVIIFRLYILYNKHKMIKIGTQNREISQVLSQVLEYFFCRLDVRCFCTLSLMSSENHVPIIITTNNKYNICFRKYSNYHSCYEYKMMQLFTLFLLNVIL